MKYESDNIRKFMNIMEGNISNSNILNEGPAWDRFKTNTKAAFGNKNAQGSQKRQNLAKRLEDSWEMWLGQTDSTGTYEDLRDFLSTKAGFTPEDTDIIMNNISNNKENRSFVPTDNIDGSSDISPQKQSDNPTTNNNQKDKSTKQNNPDPIQNHIDQTLSDYEDKFRLYFKNSDMGRKLNREEIQEIDYDRSRVSSMISHYRDKLTDEQKQRINDLNDSANTMLVNSGYINPESHGFNSEDLRNKQRQTSNIKRPPTKPQQSSSNVNFGSVNNATNNTNSTTDKNGVKRRQKYADFNKSNGVNSVNGSTIKKTNSPSKYDISINGKKTESRIFEAGIIQGENIPMDKDEVRKIFNIASAYAFKKGLVGNSEYNNQNYTQQNYRSSDNRSNMNRSDITRMKKDLKTDINSDVLRTAINTAHISVDQLDDLRDEATSHDIKNIKSPETMRGLAAVGWSFFRNLGK